MGFLYRLLGTAALDEGRESTTRFGVTLLSLVASCVYLVFAAIYWAMGVVPLFWYFLSQSPVTFVLYLFCRRGKPTAFLVTYLVLTFSVIILHIMITYYIGDCGSVFIVFSAIIVNHLFPVLKKKTAILLDLVIVACINLTFWLAQNHTPVYSVENLAPLRFIIMNIGIAICLFDLYVSVFVQAAADKNKQKHIEQVSREARIDVLTGLGNRRMLDIYREEVEQDTTEGRHVCFAMVDIDYFKDVNDTYGHDTGDAVLVALAKMMRDMFRKSDVLMRWGGEEFLLLLWDIDLSAAVPLAERFQNRLRELPVEYAGQAIKVTVTIGLCEHTHDDSIDETVRRADELMYCGKKEGRDRIVYS